MAAVPPFGGIKRPSFFIIHTEQTYKLYHFDVKNEIITYTIRNRTYNIIKQNKIIMIIEIKGGVDALRNWQV